MTTQGIRIGGAGKWADEDRIPAPNRPTQPTPIEPITTSTLPDDDLADLPPPRSFQDIVDQRSVLPATPAARQPVKQGSAMGVVILIAMVVLVAMLAIGVLLANVGERFAIDTTPGRNADPSNVATMQGMAAPAGRVSQNSMAVGDIIDPGKDIEAKVLTIGSNGSFLAQRKSDDAYGIGIIDNSNPCKPNFWSPPGSWATAQVQDKFISEQASCYDIKGEKIRVLGYWQTSNWIFIMRPKSDNSGDWDTVWTDITWYGGDIAEARKLTGSKDYYQAPAPVVPSQPPSVPPAQPAGNVVSDAPVATAGPPACTPDRENVVVSDLTGTYYGCNGVAELLAQHPGAMPGDANTARATRATADAAGAIRAKEIKLSIAATASANASYATAQAVRKHDQEIIAQQATAATAAAAPQATADAQAALQVVHDALQGRITPTQGPLKTCLECHH
jgi:hypothetical protein